MRDLLFARAAAQRCGHDHLLVQCLFPIGDSTRRVYPSRLLLRALNSLETEQ
jgi:hypothetical protein